MEWGTYRIIFVVLFTAKATLLPLSSSELLFTVSILYSLDPPTFMTTANTVDRKAPTPERNAVRPIANSPIVSANMKEAKTFRKRDKHGNRL